MNNLRFQKFLINKKINRFLIDIKTWYNRIKISWTKLKFNYSKLKKLINNFLNHLLKKLSNLKLNNIKEKNSQERISINNKKKY